MPASDSRFLVPSSWLRVRGSGLGVSDLRFEDEDEDPAERDKGDSLGTQKGKMVPTPSACGSKGSVSKLELSYSTLSSCNQS